MPSFDTSPKAALIRAGMAAGNADEVAGMLLSATQAAGVQALLSGPGIPRILAQSGIPMILPGSGTIGNNGALTLGTALFPANNYPLSAFAYFPTGALFAGSVAGIYYTVLSSSTTGTVYQNLYAGGAPVIPAAPLAWATTGPGAYVQTVGVTIPMISTTVAGGSMGTNGSIRTSGSFNATSNANSKVYFNMFGGASVQGANVTTSTFLGLMSFVRNRGVANKQVVLNGSYGDVQTAGNINYVAVNTLVDQVTSIGLQLTVATDNALIEGFTQELLFM